MIILPPPIPPIIHPCSFFTRTHIIPTLKLKTLNYLSWTKIIKLPPTHMYSEKDLLKTEAHLSLNQIKPFF